MEDYIRKVANFAVLAQQREDWPVLEINIESFALRRKLSQELAAIYKDSNMIFTSFSKASPIFTVRKHKAVDKNAGQNEFKKQEDVKVTLEELEQSEVDKIIEGQRDGLKVYFEDDKIIAFGEKKPVAKVHILIVAKDIKLTSLKKVQEG